MKQKVTTLIVALLGVFFGSTLLAGATSTFITQQGGTGTTSPSGILYGDNGATGHLNTVTLGANCTFVGGVLNCTSPGSPYPFQLTGNATSTLTQFNGGLTAYASSTISALHLVNPLEVASGGTGSTTLSGILKGNGISGILTAVGNTDYQLPISLTTTGSSGAATFNGTTLNIPQYTSGSPYPFPLANNATSTTVGFNNGLISSASTTFSYLGTGAVYSQTGLILTHATTSASAASQDVWRDANQNAFAQNFVSAATVFPSLGTTATLTAASPRTWVVTGTNVQTFKLPVGTTLTAGATYVFNNNSTGLVTVIDNGSNVLGVVPTGGNATFQIWDVSTSNGQWDGHPVLGHSNVSGTATLGIGTTTPWGGLSASSTSANPTLAIQQLSTGPAAIFLGGNVGIGTTSPVTSLAVNGAIHAFGQFLASSTDSALLPGYSWLGDLTTGMFHAATQAIGWAVGGVEQMRLTSTGLGIGSTTPTVRLSVGSGTASSSATIAEYAYGTGSNVATSTAYTFGPNLASNHIVWPIGTAATTFTLCMEPGQTLTIRVLNPNASAGAITWAACSGEQLYWTTGTVPTQTTTANNWDIWSFIASQTVGSTSNAITISGAQTPTFH